MHKNRMKVVECLPFEMCKQAKDLGYPQETEGQIIGPFDAWDTHGLDYGLSSHIEDYEHYVVKITAMELQRWLRQTQGVIMYVVPCDISSSGGWAYNVRVWSKGKLLVNKEQQCSSVSLKFEEAMIEGLEHSLELLGK